MSRLNDYLQHWRDRQPDSPIRLGLARYAGKQLLVTGRYVTTVWPYRVAVEAIECESSDGTVIPIHHAWVQFASEIVRAKPHPIPGDLLYFVATVHRYPMIPRTPARWGLRCPTNVIVQPQTRGRR